MKSHSHSQRTLAAICFALLGTGSATWGATEIGNDSAFVRKLSTNLLVDLDVGGIPPADASIDDLPIGLTDAEIGWAIDATPHLRGEVLLVHEAGTPTWSRRSGCGNPTKRNSDSEGSPSRTASTRHG